jgi:hypothetical protein
VPGLVDSHADLQVALDRRVPLRVLQGIQYLTERRVHGDVVIDRDILVGHDDRGRIVLANADHLRPHLVR